MKCWSTFGAFGSDVVELSLLDIAKLLCGKELKFSSTVISFGKSREVSLGSFESREAQLKRKSQ